MTCLALAVSPGAQAGVVDYYGGTEWIGPSVEYSDRAAERNDVVLSEDPRGFIFTEQGPAPLVPGAADSPDGRPSMTFELCRFQFQRAFCFGIADFRLVLRIHLGIGNDQATLGVIASVWGGEGDDYVVGSKHGDTLEGGPGRDILLGGPGDDSINGVANPLLPDDDSDIIRGQDGGDDIDARDGHRDEVNCGPGYDRTWVDVLDWVNADCEEVYRP